VSGQWNPAPDLSVRGEGLDRGGEGEGEGLDREGLGEGSVVPGSAAWSQLRGPRAVSGERGRPAVLLYGKEM
jgi:hypothetical protein